ncbi:tail fiber protein [Dactylosporangium fulvum]|uniref:Tail fiber protein n=1 Tax=Dactylosporangium fulvum TaxID=53359 RepID=A0ABY5WD82_9ACTN|nr:tail fiber protein [Dactylosporangium fulvum]UWP87211.1 tail fiber protein [Dactylosporangium fulvum]
MTEPYIGEIRIFAGNFAPNSWALCDGQVLPIVQNTALFSIIGTAFGGDGQTTFALPDLRGAAPVAAGQGPGLGPYTAGQRGGSASATLTVAELPPHTHTATGAPVRGDRNSPAAASWAEAGLGRVDDRDYGSAPDSTTMHPAALTPAGNGQPHNNLPPYLVVNFIIALSGIFPQRP